MSFFGWAISHSELANWWSWSSDVCVVARLTPCGRGRCLNWFVRGTFRAEESRAHRSGRIESRLYVAQD
jgi:hypothetical protein